MGQQSTAVASVLAGEALYDGLGVVEQAAVRAVWDERIAVRRAGLGLVAEFRAAGRRWVESDPAAACQGAQSERCV
jgi:hypothetical protein